MDAGRTECVFIVFCCSLSFAHYFDHDGPFRCIVCAFAFRFALFVGALLAGINAMTNFHSKRLRPIFVIYVFRFSLLFFFFLRRWCETRRPGASASSNANIYFIHLLLLLFVCVSVWRSWRCITCKTVAILTKQKSKQRIENWKKKSGTKNELCGDGHSAAKARKIKCTHKPIDDNDWLW